MRYFGILAVVLTALSLSGLGLGVRTALASIPILLETDLAQSFAGRALTPASHSGHVMSHRPLPGGDTTSLLCRILCTMATWHAAFTLPDDLGDVPAWHERFAVPGAVGVRQAALKVQPPPP